MTTLEKTEIHPLDFDSLHKGMWIEPEDLERATLSFRDDSNFDLEVLRLAGMIEKKTGILCHVSGKRLRLMTDGEAVRWNIRQAAVASRALDRADRRLRENIDRANLSESDLVVHDHASRVITAMAEAQRRERQKAAELFAFVTTPALLVEDNGED